MQIEANDNKRNEIAAKVAAPSAAMAAIVQAPKRGRCFNQSSVSSLSLSHRPRKVKILAASGFPGGL